MTGGMVWIRDADLGIRTIVLFARELERDNTGDIGLKRQNLEVVHELCVVGKRCGYPYRPIEIRHIVVRRCLFSALDLALYLTDAFDVLIQAHAIGTADALFELSDVSGERIEQACPIVKR